MELDPQFDEQVCALVKEAVPGRFKKVDITKDTFLQKELGLDSLAILALVFRFEETFGVDLSQVGLNVDVSRLRTVGDLIDTGRGILQQLKTVGNA
jgi:acyl carrier protein